jgi:hypothetical protein
MFVSGRNRRKMHRIARKRYRNDEALDHAFYEEGLAFYWDYAVSEHVLSLLLNTKIVKAGTPDFKLSENCVWPITLRRGQWFRRADRPDTGDLNTRFLAVAGYIWFPEHMRKTLGTHVGAVVLDEFLRVQVSQHAYAIWKRLQNTGRDATKNGNSVFVLGLSSALNREE